ncbi:hypothetical protein JCGZ_03736 [Jatropha curcas]|uniref:Uncharacterized protein n=1 Tax=Jatropha curcas TaxID=180498 RepID=A0A067JFM1_JATCU|nr:hypothetical protein JCGZ_03736 [Jatropha curcas]
MAAKNLADLLPRGVVIDPVNRLLNHGMKLWEFIPDAGSSISLRLDLPSHLYWSTSEGDQSPLMINFGPWTSQICRRASKPLLALSPPSPRRVFDMRAL